MIKESPLTEIIIEPIQKKIFNLLEINSKTFSQIAIMFILFSLYYNFYGQCERSSILYLVSYLCFYSFYKLEPNSNKIQEGLMLYFIFNILFLFKNISKDNNYSIIGVILLIATFYSMCIRHKNDINVSENKLLNAWSNLLNKTSNNIYPNDSDFLQNYHINNFWKFFDFSLLSLFIFILISYEG